MQRLISSADLLSQRNRQLSTTYILHMYDYESMRMFGHEIDVLLECGTREAVLILFGDAKR